MFAKMTYKLALAAQVSRAMLALCATKLVEVASQSRQKALYSSVDIPTDGLECSDVSWTIAKAHVLQSSIKC